MTHRNAVLYKATLLLIQNLCPNFQLNLKHAMMDYEQAPIKSLNEVFPYIQIHICWFHSKKVKRMHRFFFNLDFIITHVLA